MSKAKLPGEANEKPSAPGTAAAAAKTAAAAAAAAEGGTAQGSPEMPSVWEESMRGKWVVLSSGITDDADRDDLAALVAASGASHKSPRCPTLPPPPPSRLLPPLLTQGALRCPIPPLRNPQAPALPCLSQPEGPIASPPFITVLSPLRLPKPGQLLTRLVRPLPPPFPFFNLL